MTKQKRTKPPKPRPEITFPALCAIVKRILERLPTIDNIDLKETVKEWVSADGFRGPDTNTVYRATDAMEHAYPKLRQAPAIEIPRPPERPPNTSTIQLEDWTRENLGFVEDRKFTSIAEIVDTITTRILGSTSKPDSQP